MKRRKLILVGEVGLFFIESLVLRQMSLALAVLLLGPAQQFRAATK